MLSASALIDCYDNDKGATPKIIHCNESVVVEACFYQERIGTDEIERRCGDEDHFDAFVAANAVPNNTNISISSKMDKCMQTLVMRTCLCSQMECNGNCESENCKTVTSDEEVNEVCDPKCTKMTNSNGIESKGAFLMVMIFHVTRRIMAWIVCRPDVTLPLKIVTLKPQLFNCGNISPNKYEDRNCQSLVHHRYELNCQKENPSLTERLLLI